MKYLLHPEADEEFAGAVRYYSQISPELGVRLSWRVFWHGGGRVGRIFWGFQTGRRAGARGPVERLRRQPFPVSRRVGPPGKGKRKPLPPPPRLPAFPTPCRSKHKATNPRGSGGSVPHPHARPLSHPSPSISLRTSPSTIERALSRRPSRCRSSRRLSWQKARRKAQLGFQRRKAQRALFRNRGTQDQTAQARHPPRPQVRVGPLRTRLSARDPSSVGTGWQCVQMVLALEAVDLTNDHPGSVRFRSPIDCARIHFACECGVSRVHTAGSEQGGGESPDLRRGRRLRHEPGKRPLRRFGGRDSGIPQGREPAAPVPVGGQAVVPHNSWFRCNPLRASPLR